MILHAPLILDNTIESTQFDKDVIINREMNSNLFVKQKESFDNNNSNTNSLLEEIQTLKKKLKFVYEKDKEIQKLKNDLSKLNAENIKFSSVSRENTKLKTHISSLTNDIDKLRIELSTLDKIKTENKYLKKTIELLEKSNTSDNTTTNNNTDNTDITDNTIDNTINNTNITDNDIDSIINNTENTNTSTDDTFSFNIDFDKSTTPITQLSTNNSTNNSNNNSTNNSTNNSNNIDDSLTIDIDSLKNILVNRLKTYQENHIDSLLISYNIKDNTTVDKKIIMKLLTDAIHP